LFVAGGCLRQVFGAEPDASTGAFTMRNSTAPRLAVHAAAAALLLSLSACVTAPDTAAPAGAPGAGPARPETIGGPPPAPAERRAPIPWADSLAYMAEGPFPVELASVPVGGFDANNKRDRGWGQQGKPRRIPGPLPAAEIERLREAAQRLAANPGILGQVAPGAPTAGIGFDSIDYTQCCGGGGNVPPDPEVAVGPNHIIAVVNVAMAIYDKSGTLLVGPTTLSSFFSGIGGGCGAVFDPNVLYDEKMDRFIVGVDGNGTDYCVAASQTSDPTAGWNRYRFATNIGGAFFDYPHAGVGVDAIFMGSNQFGGTPGFEGRVFAMDKAAMYAGASMATRTFSTGGFSTPQPMNLHGISNGTFPTSGPHYIMTESFDGANHNVWRWTDPFGANQFVKTGDLNLNAATGVTAGFPVDVPQSGGQQVQANDWRGLDTEYRNGKIWMTNTIACNPGSGTVNCIRWARIDPATPAIEDAGVYATNGEYRFFPDLAVNECGDMAVGYTKSSASMFPSIFVSGREAGDPAGTLQTEVLAKAGTIAYTAFDTAPRRWGDYTGMTIDPDGKTFWYLGEYSKDTGTTQGRWGTYVASFSFPNCGGATAFTVGAPVPGLAGFRVVNEWAVSGATPNSPLTVISGRPGGTGTVTVAGCPSPIPVAVARPGVRATGTADANGAATLAGRLWPWFAGRELSFQAIDGTACVASPPVTVTIN
jgi:hypothetical protein